MKKSNKITSGSPGALNARWSVNTQRSKPSINERAHSSSVASGRGKIADEALRRFSWEGGDEN